MRTQTEDPVENIKLTKAKDSVSIKIRECKD
jgi:hypothetical protein